MAQPDQDPFRSLHERLLAGDRLASEELVRLVLPPLLADAGRRFPRIDEQIVSDGVIDAVLEYCASPQSFDAGKNVPLDRFLGTAAWRNVDNLLKGESRRKQRERRAGSKKREADVAFDPVARNIRQEEQQGIEEKKSAMLQALKDPQDRELLSLRLQGIHDTASAARVLGITGLSLDEQRSDVKRRKDRIMRFLRRKGLLP